VNCRGQLRGEGGGLRVGGVRYHCGGWPEEVNTCFLNSYMVYL
jgi:hypothetical protein